MPTNHCCFTCRSYGVTLWYPTYVNELNIQKDAELFQTFCSKDVDYLSDLTIPQYCGCSGSFINNSVISDTKLENFVINSTVFSNVTFERVNFVHSSFLNTTFETGSGFTNCTFSNSAFTEVKLDNFTFTNFQLDNSRLCGVLANDLNSDNVTIYNTSINHVGSNNTINGTSFIELLKNTTNTSLCEGKEWSFQCPKKEDDFRVYRDSFFISASALPGNLASMVAVYFLIRKYWLGKVTLHCLLLGNY